MGSSDVRLQAAAGTLEQIIRTRGKYAHVHVRPQAGHLNIEAEGVQGTRVITARATPLDATEYGLSFRKYTGQWEPMPVSGSLEQIAEGMIELLGPYLDRANI
jgi:hypothetical protein